MYKRNQVFAAACLGLLLFGMTLITLGSILPILSDKFGNDGFSAAVAVSLLPLGILAGSLVFGPIVDRYGYKLLLAASILVSALAMAGIALTYNLLLLYTCIFFIGLGGGIINGGTSALVADISEANKGANLSILGVFFGIGALGMPLLLGLLSRQFDYRQILLAVGIFMFLTVAYFLFIKFPAPKQAQGFPVKEGVKLLKEPVLLLSAFFLFFQSGLESLVNNWTTSFFQDQIKTSDEDALYALSFSLLGLTLARILLGGLLKKFSPLGVLLVSLLLVGLGGLLLLFANTYSFAFAALVVCGIGIAAGFPVILGYIGQLYASLSGTAFSIAFVIALGGNMIINYIFGRIAAQAGTQYLPIAILACILCMIALLFFIQQKITVRPNLIHPNV
ncbi:MAG TPA: MFS transporter [Chitinophagaceae bacterium]|nr:MFS transporter [Chitinophagaceae bacterium]